MQILVTNFLVIRSAIGFLFALVVCIEIAFSCTKIAGKIMLVNISPEEMSYIRPSLFKKNRKKIQIL